jgi:hypothetical protein
VSQQYHTPNKNVLSSKTCLILGVSEGYATHRFSPPSPQTLNSTSSSSINDPIFRSSNDTLHAVYSQFSCRSITSSDRKRARPESSLDEREEHPDRDSMEQVTGESDAVMQSTSVIAVNDLALSRPVKPLRRTFRTFAMTQSLPPAVFLSSAGGQDKTTLSAGLIEEEEDWSTAAFSTDPLNTQTQSLG